MLGNADTTAKPNSIEAAHVREQSHYDFDDYIISSGVEYWVKLAPRVQILSLAREVKAGVLDRHRKRMVTFIETL